MIFDLQKFAEGEAPAGESTTTESADTSTAENTDNGNKADDVQAKIDAAVSAQLAKIQSKMEADFKKREELAKKEAERLSKLSDDERAKAELENTRNELEKQKADFEREKLKYEAAKVLSQRNLPVDFVDYLIGGDNETTLDNIKIFEKKFNKAVEDTVNARLKGRAPQTSGKSAESTGSKDSFIKAITEAQIKYR